MASLSEALPRGIVANLDCEVDFARAGAEWRRSRGEDAPDPHDPRKELVIALPGTRPYTVRVRDDGGAPVANVRVFISVNSLSGFGVTTGPSGDAVFDDMPASGTFRMHVTEAPEGYRAPRIGGKIAQGPHRHDLPCPPNAMAAIMHGAPPRAKTIMAVDYPLARRGRRVLVDISLGGRVTTRS